MRILIISLGSIGRRHLTNLKRIDPTIHVTVWRHNAKLAGETEMPGADRVVYQLDDALEAKPDAALITGPASLHVQTGLELARRGIHLFIEKPLSNTLDGVDALLDICSKQSLMLMVGYNFRFYRPLQLIQRALREGLIGRPVAIRAEVGQYLPDWRPTQDYRQGVSAQRALGGGVVLELSHELDYVRWMIGEIGSVSAYVGHLSDLCIDVEDTAEIILQFRNGAIGSVHLDMVQRDKTRTCRIIGTDGIITWDGMSHRAQLYSIVTQTWSDLHPACTIERDVMYIAELRHFLECVSGTNVPVPSGQDGKRVLQIALAVKQSSLERKAVEL